MNIAIYQYHRSDSVSQDMNQSAEHLILSAVTMCKDKATELYGPGQNFIQYVDMKLDMIQSNYMKGAYVRPELERLLEDIHLGRIDTVIVTYMGAVASDFNFVIAFYIYLCQHNVKLVTVREGERINEMMEQALEEFRKKAGL
ncbi:MAG: recombinase family protein [Eubacterium sp.]|nr:recombinase family protein [Eubacterium sp.]